MVKTMSNVAKRISGVKYLLPNWIPYGMVTGLVAEPGVGKSAVALWLCRAVATASTVFGVEPIVPDESTRRALWCATENDLAITIQRMNDWSIPMDALVLPFDDELQTVNLALAGDLETVESVVRDECLPLVLIDSLRGSHAGDENNSTVSQILQDLGAMATRTGAAVVVVHHTRKLTVDEELTANSSRGSNAIMALMRSLIGLDKPDRDSNWIRVRVLKENLGIAPAPLGVLVGPRGVEFGPAPIKPARARRTEEAAAWLCANMTPGKWYKATKLTADAKAAGFVGNTLQRARELLRITTGAGNIKPDKNGVSHWRRTT